MRHPLTTLLALASCALFSAAGPAAAADPAASGLSHGKLVGARLSSTGTVTAVDTAERLVTVKNPQGVERSYRVDPAVQSLESVKVGDRVRLDYLVAVAVALRKGGDGIREKVESEATAREPSNGRPGVQAQRQTTLVANVLSVDRARQTVRLQGPEGRVGDFKVRDKVALADVRAGDQVVAVVQEALAVGVKPAGPAGAAASAAR